MCMYYPPSLATFNIEIVVCLKHESLQYCRWSKIPHPASRWGSVSEFKCTGEEKTADFSQSFCSQSQMQYNNIIPCLDKRREQYLRTLVLLGKRSLGSAQVTRTRVQARFFSFLWAMFTAWSVNNELYFNLSTFPFTSLCWDGATVKEREWTPPSLLHSNHSWRIKNYSRAYSTTTIKFSYKNTLR